jgi:hypothetical protein
MKQLFYTLSLVFLLGSLAAQPVTKVLFIGIDGVRSDALRQANTPNMDSLAAGGTFTFSSWHLRTTMSGPSWSAMLTGVWEEKHGVTSNNYSNPNWTEYPYFVTRAKEFRPDIKAVQITSWDPMSSQVTNDGWDQKVVLGEDNDCVAAGVSLLANDTALDVLFVHIDDVDATGHANGFNPLYATYINAIEYADVQVGQLMTALKSRPNFNNESWVVMLTTDHGGLGNGHGGVTREEREIWWIGWSNLGALPKQELIVDLGSLDPLDYIFPNANDFDEAPLLVDICVTAIDHLLPNVDPDTVTRWDLDGKSWLNKTTGINNITVNVTGGNIFPNPTNGTFTLSMQHVKHDISYRLFDLDGRAITSGSVPFTADKVDVQLDLRKEPAGVYLLEVTHNGISMVNRIVKN